MNDAALAELERAEGLADQGRFSEALAVCDAVLAQDFNSAAALNLKGYCLARLDRVEEALQQFKRARLALPIYAPIRFNLGRALEDTGLLEEGRAEYEEALKLDPDHMLALAHRGWVRSRLGDAAGGLADAAEAARRDPGLPDAWALRGACLAMAGRPDEAEADFRRALEMDPGQASRIQALRAASGHPGGAAP